MANEWARYHCVTKPLLDAVTKPAGTAAESYAAPGVQGATSKVQNGGYCQACFKNFRSDFRSLDENGNCRIHGGQFGQAFDVSKTKQRLAGVGLVGALALFLASKANKNT